MEGIQFCLFPILLISLIFLYAGSAFRVCWACQPPVLHLRKLNILQMMLCRFAAALASQKVWVMNVVPVHAPNTLPIIFERGLMGLYHDWCEPFSTYPRSYDLLHADHLFSRLKNRYAKNFVSITVFIFLCYCFCQLLLCRGYAQRTLPNYQKIIEVL